MDFSMQQNGYAVYPRVITPGQVQDCRDAFQRIYEGKFDLPYWPREWYYRQGVIAPGVTGHASGVWRSSSVLSSITLHPGLAAHVRDAMGWPSIRLAYDTLWHKPAGGSAVPYHQDDSYVGAYFGTRSATLWIPLDDITEENGGIEYVEGSHQYELTPIGDSFHGTRETYRAPYEKRFPNGAAPTVITDLRAGSATLHDGRTWHGSAINVSDAPRRAHAIHYVPGDTTIMAQPGYVFENINGVISAQHHPILD